MTNKPQPKRLTIILPKRYCLNCKRLLKQGSSFQCCSAKCSNEYKATLERIDAADKETVEMPF